MSTETALGPMYSW